MVHLPTWSQALERLRFDTRVGREVAVLVAYALLTLLMTYPLAARFTTALPGDGRDGWLFSWDLWWFKRAVLDLGTTPFFSGEVHYPYGASLLFHSLAPALCLIALPLTTAFGVAVAYNVLAFAGFWLSGYGAYRLSAYVLRDLEPAGETTATRLAAFLGGAAWAFGAYHFAHLLGHLEIASPQWLPFFVLFLVKSWREPGWASPLAAGFFLVMTGLTAWYYWLHLLCFAGLFIVYHLIVDRPPRVYAALVRTSAALGIGNLVLSPWLAPMVLHGSSAALPDHRGQILALSADLVSPFVPSFQHPLWGKWLTPLQLRLMPDGNLSESTLFVGYTSLALAAIASIGRRDRSRFWLVAFLFFWVMSLGPLLHAGGRLVTLFDQPIPMPFLVLSALPSMATFRGTSRFFALGALALGVLTALGSRRLLGRARTTVGLWLTFAALLTAVLFESAAIPYPMTAIDVPPVYKAIAADPGRGAVLEVPIPDDPALYPQRMLYQTAHQKPVYGGYLSRGLPPLPFASLPGFAQLKRLPGEVWRPEILTGASPRDTAIAALNRYGAGYVILDRELLSASALERARSAAGQLLGADRLFFDDSRSVAFRVPPIDALSQPTLLIGDGWHDLEQASADAPPEAPERWRWIADEASLEIAVPRSRAASIHLSAWAFGENRRIAVVLDGTLLATIETTWRLEGHLVPLGALSKGFHTLRLRSLDGTGRTGPDARALSIAVYDVHVVEAGS